MKKTPTKKSSNNPTHVPRKGEITVTSKLRLKDCLVWGDKVLSIQKLINNHPIELWNLIHPENGRDKADRKISLVRPAYARLKSRVNEIDPKLVEKVNKQHEHYKAMRKLKKEISNGIFGTSKSKFKKIAPRKVEK